MMVYSTLKHAKKLIVLVVGATIVLLGVAMLVLPGPGLVVIVAGLAILATEFLWAKRLLRKVKEGSIDLGNKVWNGRSKE